MISEMAFKAIQLEPDGYGDFENDLNFSNQNEGLILL